MQNANYLSLDANQALSIKAAQIRVESGIVWLTQRGQPDDVLLFAGQAFDTQRSDRVVIQSLAAGTAVSVQPRSLFSGVGRWLAGLVNAGNSSITLSAAPICAASSVEETT